MAPKFYSNIVLPPLERKRNPWLDDCNIRKDRVALTSCNIQLLGKKPVNPAYPEELITLGDHLRKARLDKGLLQKDVSKQLKVDVMTITNWENNRSEPMSGYYSKLVEFIGYKPDVFDKHRLLGEKLNTYRKDHKMSQKELALKIGVGLNTLRNIEGRFYLELKKKFKSF